MDVNFKTAGIIIIGNEILKGHVRDLNSYLMCKRFHAIGVKVCRISTVPDEITEIAEEVARFSSKYDIVITTGGIGPTHDDITYKAIARAVGDQIILHAEMADVIQYCFQGSRDIKDNPALKMAMIPQSSKLIYILPKMEKGSSDKDKHNGLQQECSFGFQIPFPVVQVKNIYVLPGMTEWLVHAFDQLQIFFQNSNFNIYTMVMFLNSSEVKILKELNKAVAEFDNRVIFGSYPSHSNNSDFSTKIVLEGTSMDAVSDAYSYLKSLLPAESINDELQTKNAQLVYDLSYGNKSLSEVVRHSLKITERALKEHDSKEIYVSFNGGKDCTVLLHLVWAVNKIMGNAENLNCVYIKTDIVFPEVDKFMSEMIKKYNLNVSVICGPIKKALTDLHKAKPCIKAIFMGTRRTDPYSQNLQEFQMCDKDWPPLMRVNPILDWSYHDIWNFLRILPVPYCSLYEMGYTSIGSPKNTLPNPALRINNSGVTKYLPAYKLKEELLERQGRK